MFENEKLIGEVPTPEYDCSYHPRFGNQVRDLKPAKNQTPWIFFGVLAILVFLAFFFGG